MLLQNAKMVVMVVRILNEALEADPVAVESLFQNRVSCNEKLGKHPTIQCLKTGEVISVSILGLLNGFFPVENPEHPGAFWGSIAAIYGVSCPHENGKAHKKQAEAEGKKWGNTNDACPICGATLVLGELEKFAVAPWVK